MAEKFVMVIYTNRCIYNHGPYNIDKQPRYLSTLLLVLFFEWKWLNFSEVMARHLSQKKKGFVTEKHSVRFKMIRKLESSWKPRNPAWYRQLTLVSFHSSTGFTFWVRMVKFFAGNSQPFISKRQKDSSEKSIPFVLESYGKMTLLGI